ncbi:MAG: J domain-containing protein [Deltaproteobacteria bacterium]|nr:J domain-containing protein [Deltaproteobacteria bacterium]
MLQEHFRTLRVAPGSSLDEIRDAYVKLVKRYPPEQFPDKFRAVKSAYDCLSLSDDFVNLLCEDILKSDEKKDLINSFLAPFWVLPKPEKDLLSLDMDLTEPESQADVFDFLASSTDDVEAVYFEPPPFPEFSSKK